MDNRKPIRNDDPLAGPLQRDAQVTRPHFSESLDVRLRAAIHAAKPAEPRVVGWALARRCRTFYTRRAEAHTTAQGGTPVLRGKRLLWAFAAAASIALLVGLVFYRHSLQQVPSHSIAETTPAQPAEPQADEIDSAADLVESTTTGLSQWMAATIDENQWAGLDRDAETALATVTGPLPFDLSAVAITDPAE